MDSIAGSSSLCRFENRFDRSSVDALNLTLLDSFAIAARALPLLPRYRRTKHRCLFLDVDSTYIDLHGNQEEKSYNGHYRRCCLAPVLRYLQGYPTAVFGSGGTRDARKVLEHQFKRLAARLQAKFPDYLIVLRGDAGFNSKLLIELAEACGIKYVTGLSPNQRAARQLIKYRKVKKVPRYTASGKARRIIGKINYQARSWGEGKRRVVARKQYDPRTNQADLRLIQTNIVHTTNRRHEGWSGELSGLSNEQLYEKIYCGRANMERSISEFKSECFGARASATKFAANCYRMILAMYCQLILKTARRFQIYGLKNKEKAAGRGSIEKT